MAWTFEEVGHFGECFESPPEPLLIVWDLLSIPGNKVSLQITRHVFMQGVTRYYVNQPVQSCISSLGGSSFVVIFFSVYCCMAQ